ncbi:hypothetical protein B0I33_105155 [Prauserella shujinwangii]|uniref:DUF3806 domain-containing protein n=2 Tax=Prauserella shujinwangii TaxID=1453103 RepID=A0A2T0LUT6_9PSEU|nr:hypothetical protein B0I33_105155 [Prauserella shujinwangii]
MSAGDMASAMRDRAGSFVAAQAAAGRSFTWEPAEVSRLDGVIEAFVRAEPDSAAEHDMVMSMGSYLGELLVAQAGGRWSYDQESSAATVLLPNGLVAYPHNKVAKRLHHGGDHSLFSYFWYATTRQLLPGSASRDCA